MRRMSLLVVAVLLAPLTTANAATLYDSMPGDVFAAVDPRLPHPADPIYSTFDDELDTRIAGSFTVAGGDHALDQITFAAIGNPFMYSVSMKIYSDNSGDPGSPLVALGLQDLAVASTPGVYDDLNEYGVYTLADSSNTTLTDGAAYWLVLESNNATGGWATRSGGSTGSTSNYYNPEPFSGGTYNWISSEVQLAFRIEATSVPEPSTLLLIGTALVCLVGGDSRRRAG